LAQLDRRANNYADAARHLDACQRLGGPADAIELERGLGLIQNGIYNAELDALCARHMARADADQYVILEALSQGLTKTYRLKEALVCLNRMLVLQPNSAYALRRRAWIYSQIEAPEMAEADYRRALEIDPEDSGARLGLAEILLSFRKKGAEAAEHFERLWASRQDSTIALGLAQSWRLAGRLEDARRLLDDWLRSHPRDGPALAERGQLAMEEQALEEAVTFLRQAEANSPYLFDAHYTLFLCLTRLGRTAEAEECRVRMEQTKEESKKLKDEMAQLTAATAASARRRRPALPDCPALPALRRGGRPTLAGAQSPAASQPPALPPGPGGLLRQARSTRHLPPSIVGRPAWSPMPGNGDHSPVDPQRGHSLLKLLDPPRR
jgi:Tfp pilus assembly protein PilF